MAVFSWRTMDALQTGVKTLSSRLLGSSHLVLSADEFIEAFINPDHVGPLKQTQALVGAFGSYAQTFKLYQGEQRTCYGAYCTFGYNEPPIIIPRYVEKEGVRSTAPEPVAQKISSWLDERVRLGNMFGDALDALHWLNDNCGNAAAMAVMFPALPTILKAFDPEPDSSSSKKARKIADAKSFGSLPRLPREVKQRMIDCSDLLLTTSMLEAAPATASLKRGEAEMYLTGAIDKRPDFIWAAILDGKPTKEASFV